MFPGLWCIWWLLPIALVYYWLIRPWHQNWGATEIETFKPMPGDNLVARPRVAATRAISINAMPHEVWPWLVQLGYGRAGFYTFDFIERTRTHDGQLATRIVDELQDLALGDRIALSPDGPHLRVAVLEPNQALVLYGMGHPTTLAEYEPDSDLPVFMQFTWTFVLSPQRDGTTRLVVRERYDFKPWWPSGVVVQGAALGSAVMTRKMLGNIKAHVEAIPRIVE